MVRVLMHKRGLRRTLLLLCFVIAFATKCSGQGLPLLPPLSAEELEMKDAPKQPGAPAVILYYGVETDNLKSTERRAVRLKILTAEGRKYGNVEIPYVEKYAQIDNIQARSVGSDGKTMAVPEKVYDRVIAKTKKLHYQEKVFTFANVEPGTVIEYGYRLSFRDAKLPKPIQHSSKYYFLHGVAYPAAEWEVQRNLYLVHGHFKLIAAKDATIREFRFHLPEQAPLKTNADASVEADIRNLPGLEDEPLSPPEDTRRGKIDLYYAEGFANLDGYWFDVAKQVGKEYEAFIGNDSPAIKSEVARLVSPKDDDETKVRKLYERAQQVHQITLTDKPEQGIAHEQWKQNKTADDVLARGYAFGNEVNLFFLALVRAAGFYAHAVIVKSRSDGFFQKENPNREQLNAMVVAVGTAKHDYFLDPASAWCPFGLLPWFESSAGGVSAAPLAPGLFSTPDGRTTDAVMRTDGQLRLSDDGTMSGTLRQTYGRQQTFLERRWAEGEDEVSRRQHLEQAMKEALPSEATVKLLRSGGWQKEQAELTAEYEVEIPNFATVAGKRLVVPAGILHTRDANPFSTPNRVNSIYFEYPYETYDDLQLQVAAGMKVESVPKGKEIDLGGVSYKIATEAAGDTIHIVRRKRIAPTLVSAEQYTSLRVFFNVVAMGDTQVAAVVKEPAP